MGQDQRVIACILWWILLLTTMTVFCDNNLQFGPSIVEVLLATQKYEYSLQAKCATDVYIIVNITYTMPLLPETYHCKSVGLADFDTIL